MEPYVKKTEKDLKDLAVKLFQGRIFTSRQIHKSDMRLIQSIFMPLFFSGSDIVAWLKENKIDILYGDMADTFGRSLNGYPTFHTVGYLDQDDSDKMIEKYLKIKEAVDKSD